MSNLSKDFNPNTLVGDEPEEKKAEDDIVADIGEELTTVEKLPTEEEIIKAIQLVEDPELMINVWDLGLIYKIDIKENGNVIIDMTLTAPACPVAEELPIEIAENVSNLTPAGNVKVKLVWDPIWSPERLSDDAKMMFDIFD